MLDVTLLKMFQNPGLYEAVYCNPQRGIDKYSREIKSINNLVEKEGIEKKVLDIGCGTGNHLFQLAELGYKGHGIDINRPMLEQAKSKTKGQPLSFSLDNMSSFNLETQFPILLCMYGAFNYLPNEESIEESIKCFYQHTSNGGVLIIDSRWAKNQPKGVMLENRSDGITIAREWTLKDGDKLMHAVYKVAFIKEGNESILMYEEHPQNFSDPFYIKNKLEENSFKDVKVCDNFDFDKEVDETSSVWRTVVLARK